MVVPRPCWRPLLGIWLFASALLIAFSWSHIVAIDGWDPDDRLRLVQLHDWLAGQSWFDTTQYRLNPPDGGPMHWNRLIELPLAALVVPLRWMLGAAMADRIAAVLVPLLCLGLVMLIAAHLAARLTPVQPSHDHGRASAPAMSGYAAALLLLPAAPVLVQLLPMRIDHHGWQIVCAMTATLALTIGDKRLGGVMMGSALALWLSISLEGLPLTIGFFVLPALRWIWTGEARQRLGWSLASFALLLALLYPATRGFAPPGGCDIIGPVHLAAAGAGTAIMLAAILADPASRAVRLFAAIAAVGAAAALLLGIAPGCATGAFSGLDPLVRSYWYEQVREGLPIWRQRPDQALAFIAIPVTGLIAALVLMTANLSPDQRRRIQAQGFVLLWSVLVAILVFRAVSVAAAIAVPLQAVCAFLLFRWARARASIGARTAATALALAFILPGALVTYAAKLTGGSAPADVAAEAANAGCDTVPNLSRLGGLPTGTVLAPFDLGPGILLATPHSVLASSHHRNHEAMADQIRIFRAAPDRARALMKRRRIDYLALCPGEPELNNYRHRDPKGLGAGLARGAAPDWLEPVSLPGTHGLKVWQVR